MFILEMCHKLSLYSQGWRVRNEKVTKMLTLASLRLPACLAVHVSVNG
jgi:hypothetical protein